MLSLEPATIAPAQPLTTEPENRPTPLAALAFEELPTELHFVRSHFGIPAARAKEWVLDVCDGTEYSRRYTLAELMRRPARTQTVVLECAGHRRRELEPNTSGLQWGPGAVSEARWTGVPLAELLDSESLQGCEVMFEGADRGQHRSSTAEVPFARSIPLERALDGDVLIAWGMNGRPIPPKHGAPVRAIVPGRYGVASVKWLRRIEVLDRPFAGPFQVQDYQLDGKPLDGLRVNSLILNPDPGAAVPTGAIAVSGIAWGGSGIDAVEIRRSGADWQPATITPPQEPTGLTRWSSLLELAPGEHLVEVRAHDRLGETQPNEPEWNPLGYANNSVHRVAITARR